MGLFRQTAGGEGDGKGGARAGGVAAPCLPGRDVDEVAQRTFLAAFTRIAEFKEGTSFRACLFAIARFQLLTEITRLRRLVAAVLVRADSVRTFCLASFRKHSYYTTSGGPAGEPG